MKIIKKCSRHPRYQVKRKPRCACETCWYLWAVKHWFACVEHHVSDTIKELRLYVG